MKGGTKYAESIKNFKTYLEHTDLITKEERKIESRKKEEQEKIF